MGRLWGVQVWGWPQHPPRAPFWSRHSHSMPRVCELVLCGLHGCTWLCVTLSLTDVTHRRHSQMGRRLPRPSLCRAAGGRRVRVQGLVATSRGDAVRHVPKSKGRSRSKCRSPPRPLGPAGWQTLVGQSWVLPPGAPTGTGTPGGLAPAHARRPDLQRCRRDSPAEAGPGLGPAPAPPAPCQADGSRVCTAGRWHSGAHATVFAGDLLLGWTVSVRRQTLGTVSLVYVPFLSLHSFGSKATAWTAALRSGSKGRKLSLWLHVCAHVLRDCVTPTAQDRAQGRGTGGQGSGPTHMRACTRVHTCSGTRAYVHGPTHAHRARVGMCTHTATYTDTQ